MFERFYKTLIYTIAVVIGIATIYAVVYMESAYIDARVRRCIIEILDEWEHSGRIL